MEAWSLAPIRDVLSVVRIDQRRRQPRDQDQGRDRRGGPGIAPGEDRQRTRHQHRQHQQENLAGSEPDPGGVGQGDEVHQEQRHDRADGCNAQRLVRQAAPGHRLPMAGISSGPADRSRAVTVLCLA